MLRFSLLSESCSRYNLLVLCVSVHLFEVPWHEVRRSGISCKRLQTLRGKDNESPLSNFMRDSEARMHHRITFV